MADNLWTKLEEYQKRDCLWQYNENNIGDRNIASFGNLLELTALKIEKISSLLDKFPINKANVIIAESHQINLLASFLAGIIKGTNIFLCDPNWQQQEWQQVLSLVEPDIIFGRQETKDLVLKTKAIATKKVIAQSSFDRESLIMIPTGGSSGKIKFAMHDWSTLSASVEGFQKYFNCQKINSFCTLPLYHVSGLMQFMRSFITQGNLIIYPYKVIKNGELELNVRDYFISLVPTQLQLLINSIPTKLAEFKTVLLGGATIPRSLLNEARKHNIPLSPTYGMTETASGIVTLKPEDFLAGNNSNGKVLPHAKVAIKSKGNNPGLIKIKCDSLCLGYYPHCSDKSYIFTTDDLGYIDDRDYLYLVGRNSQKIITGGKNVFPAEVEAAILDTKLIKDVCVIGISDRQWGEAVTAVYVPLQLDRNLDLIVKKLNLQLAKYKQPKNWIKVSSLPRNNRGKINYQKVQAIANKLATKSE